MIKGPINLFTGLINAVSSITSEAKLSIDSEGIRVNAVDPANVAMINLSIPRNLFTELESEPMDLVIELNKLEDYLKIGDKSSVVSLSLDEVSHKMKLGIDKHKYSMGCVDPSAINRPPRIPELKFDATVIINGETFIKACKAGLKVSDHVELKTDGEVFTLLSTGDIDGFSSEYTRDDLIGLEGAAASSMFSTSYLDQMARVLAKVNQLSLDLGTNYPMRISMTLDGMNIVYLLAPRLGEQ